MCELVHFVHVAERLGEEPEGRLREQGTPPPEIVAAVRRVASGEPVLSPALTRRLIARVAESGAEARARAARERLSVLVGQGRSNAEIGATRYLSVPTVKTHMSRMLAKLRLNNRVQLALLAHDAGLLP